MCHSGDLTGFESNGQGEQVTAFQQLGDIARKRGRPRKLYPEFLAERFQHYSNIFQAWLEDPNAARTLLLERPEQIKTKLVEPSGYYGIFGTEHAVWIYEAVRHDRFPERKTPARARFLAEYLISHEAQTSLRYLRRLLNQTSRARPRSDSR